MSFKMNSYEKILKMKEYKREYDSQFGPFSELRLSRYYEDNSEQALNENFPEKLDNETIG